MADKRKIKASKYYLDRLGSCSITAMVGKKRKLEFDEGKAIDVNEKEFDAIKSLGWGIVPRETKEVKDGN